jgi:hypothetical protein
MDQQTELTPPAKLQPRLRWSIRGLMVATLIVSFNLAAYRYGLQATAAAGIASLALAAIVVSRHVFCTTEAAAVIIGIMCGGLVAAAGGCAFILVVTQAGLQAKPNAVEFAVLAIILLFSGTGIGTVSAIAYAIVVAAGFLFGGRNDPSKKTPAART